MTKAKINKNNLIPTNYWSHQGWGVATPTRKVEHPNPATSSLPEPHRWNCYAGNQARAQRHVNPKVWAGSAGHVAMAPHVVQSGKGLEHPPALMSQDRTQKHSSSPLPVPPPPASLPGIRPRMSGSWDHCPATHGPGPRREEAEGQRMVGRYRPDTWKPPSRAGLHRQDRRAGCLASSLPEEPRDLRPGAHSPCPGPCHLDWPSFGEPKGSPVRRWREAGPQKRPLTHPRAAGGSDCAGLTWEAMLQGGGGDTPV